MKYCMKNLKHNGIYVPSYEFQKLSVKVHGHHSPLGPQTEQMALAWARKKLSITSPPDKLFYRNFVQGFLEAQSAENPLQTFLKSFTIDHVNSLEKDDGEWMINGKLKDDSEVDFSEVTEHVLQEQQKKLSMTKEEKKRIAAERKARREALRERYGYATVDGRKLEIANWTAEPSCIFAGRGDHPRRGNGSKVRRRKTSLEPLRPKLQTAWKLEGRSLGAGEDVHSQVGRQAFWEDEVRLVFRLGLSETEDGEGEVQEGREARQRDSEGAGAHNE